MSNWKASIASSIRAIAGTSNIKDKPDVFLAEVDSVDELARTCSCTLINGTSDISLDVVNLMAEVNDGLLRIPTIGSTVYILSTPNITPWVDVFSELDKVFYVAGGSTLLLVDTGIELDGKKYGGIPEVVPLTAQIKGIQDDINTLKNIFNSWVVVPNDGGGALFALLATYKTQLITPIVRGDIENTKVLHGDGT